MTISNVVDKEKQIIAKKKIIEFVSRLDLKDDDFPLLDYYIKTRICIIIYGLFCLGYYFYNKDLLESIIFFMVLIIIYSIFIFVWIKVFKSSTRHYRKLYVKANIRGLNKYAQRDIKQQEVKYHFNDKDITVEFDGKTRLLIKNYKYYRHLYIEEGAYYFYGITNGKIIGSDAVFLLETINKDGSINQSNYDAAVFILEKSKAIIHNRNLSTHDISINVDNEVESNVSIKDNYLQYCLIGSAIGFIIGLILLIGILVSKLVLFELSMLGIPFMFAWLFGAIVGAGVNFESIFSNFTKTTRVVFIVVFPLSFYLFGFLYIFNVFVYPIKLLKKVYNLLTLA